VNVRVLAVSRRQPEWITAGFNEYARRLRGAMPIELVEIPPADRRGSNAVEQVNLCKWQEAQKIRARYRQQDWVVALDERGESLTTTALAESMSRWRDEARSPAFVIGGADGLHPEIIAAADSRASLSGLTLPHGIVRVILAEALYRAWSLLNNHPYHRA